ncbi:hypothetical protein GCM10007392_21000 [Saccharospirillum salsuginis]|uniref:Uncharacterized protein n=1 Tax=Saccharospirillum salsuginis TaxID=418750 RepID=A0A918K981_9GAMM|nr:hypothetical protein GCM10007392_21000 [Saccharospirillum salsuginis]
MAGAWGGPIGDVGSMDAAVKLTWMYSQRPRGGYPRHLARANGNRVDPGTKAETL